MAIEFYRRAIEKDPNFAIAWAALAGQYRSTNQIKLAAESMTKAYALRDRVSEFERARIIAAYYVEITGELDKAIEISEEQRRNYPRDSSALGRLAGYYFLSGQTERALAFMQEALRLDPNNAGGQALQARFLIQLNRYAEAGEVLQNALAQKLDGVFIRGQLYNLAFINGDAQTMQEQIAWATGKPQEEHVTVQWQVDTDSFGGEWRKSQEDLRRAVELTLRVEDKENAAIYTGYQAVNAAFLGQLAQAVSLAEAAPRMERNREVLFVAAFALAIAGEAAKAQPLIQELEQQHPKNTIVNHAYLPEIKAAFALHKGDAQTALDLLEPARHFEPRPWDEFWTKTLRSMAYLKLGKGAEAAAEARKVIDHRGEGPLSLLWPLAHLNLGRASAMQGDTSQAKQMYDAFFKLWQNADADLPILIAAKREYAKLK
jgi:tetratricopeptide (TPR) repeat protein